MIDVFAVSDLQYDDNEFFPRNAIEHPEVPHSDSENVIITREFASTFWKGIGNKVQDRFCDACLVISR